MAKTTKRAPANKAAKAKAKPTATPKRMPVNKQNAEPEAPAKKLSQMAAAERVLADAATLYASILRLIKAHGKDAKFQKVANGQFALAAK
jgi:hypothetical protein